jgi:hypothetical protein
VKENTLATVVAELDKTLTLVVPDGYGTMSVRVVVLKKAEGPLPPGEADVPADLGEDEALPTKDKKPTDNYLEDPKRGKECCVFLINGQRQDAWDNTFLVRDLGLKYLRNRTLLVVDLDGLKPEALFELMSGDRQGFCQGTVYHAVWARLVATLKKQPDLERLEADAERETAELRAGDEAVKQALDQLIEEHHSLADRAQPGGGQPGADGGRGPGFGTVQPNYVVVGPQAEGDPASGPYLVVAPSSNTIRLHPGEPVTLTVGLTPKEAWKDLGPVHVEVTPPIDGLRVRPERTEASVTVGLCFDEPEDWEDDHYPVEAVLRVTATVQGHDEPRLLERRIVVTKKGGGGGKRKPVVLCDEPTFLRVTSRQPVPLTPGGADTHVRLRWNGKDELADGSPSPWAFAARCLTRPDFPTMTFSKPSDGRFELLVQTPAGLTPGQVLKFEAEAAGPGGRKLKTTFTAQAALPPDPRKVKKDAPEPSSQRRPSYRLAFIKQEQWNQQCWDAERWTADDAACFRDPSETQPLILIINEDMDLLTRWQDAMRAKKLEPSTIKDRVTRYTSHVAFHLYQMYLNAHAAQEAQALDAAVAEPTPEQMRGEVNRVAATLIKVMQVRV